MSDLSHKNNRVMFDLVQKVRKERKKGTGVEQYDALVRVVTEVLKKGLKAPFYDRNALSEGVLSAAKELVRSQVGDETFESEVNTEAGDFPRGLQLSVDNFE